MPENLWWSIIIQISGKIINQAESRLRQQTNLKKNPETIAFDFTNRWFFEWIGKEFYSKVEQIK